MDEFSEAPGRSPHSRRNAIIVVLVLLVVAVGAWMMTRGGKDPSQAESAGGGMGGPGGPGGGGGGRRAAATVGIAKVATADMPETLAAIGTVTPIVTATVRPQLAGNIFSIDFTEGQIVRKGQQLAQIDPRPYRLALAQAQANLARDEAQLTLANTQLQRYRTLLAQDSIARQDVDTQAATAKQYAGTVAADRAAIGTARLNLQYTSITAPVTGRVGLRQVDIGNYVTAGDTNGVAVITQTTPIDVAFALPQADLQRLLARRAGGGALPVTGRDQANTTDLAKGQFLTFDNQIDATTGTVRAKARFPNPDGRLFPNQFVNVVLLADTLRNVPVVPVTAIRHGAQGDFVFALQDKDRHKVKLQLVKLGPASGTQVALLSGVTPGQTVVTEGADNLDDGSSVILPGEAQPRRERRKSGFFGWLFGSGGGEGQGAGQGNAAQGGGEHRHRRQQAQGGGQ